MWLAAWSSGRHDVPSGLGRGSAGVPVLPATAVNHDVDGGASRAHRLVLAESSPGSGNAEFRVIRAHAGGAQRTTTSTERSDRGREPGACRRPTSRRSQRRAAWEVLVDEIRLGPNRARGMSGGGIASLRVRRAVHHVKDLGLADLTPLRTFTRAELVEFQAALRSYGGIQTTTERVMDRLVTRRRREDTPRRASARSERRGTARQCPVATPAWLVVCCSYRSGRSPRSSWCRCRES
jgi:hypothetical protein